MGEPLTEPFFPVPESVAARRDLTPAAKLVVALITRRERNGQAAPVGLEEAGARLGLHKISVLRALRQLEALKLIERRSAGRFGSTGRRAVAATYGNILQPVGTSERSHSATVNGNILQRKRSQKASAHGSKKRSLKTDRQKDAAGPAAAQGPPPAAKTEPASLADDRLLRRVLAGGFSHAKAGGFLGWLEWRPGPDGGRFVAVDRFGATRRVQGGDGWTFLGGPAAREACRSADWPEKKVALVELAV